MTAPLHIGRRTTLHHPRPSVRERWDSFALKHFRRTQAVYFTQLHDALPLHDPDRHYLDAPSLEEAFAQIAADHPEAVTPADGGQAARDIDREQLLVAVCDRWFREAYPGPEHRWPPATVSAYERLMADVRACFHPGGAR